MPNAEHRTRSRRRGMFCLLATSNDKLAGHKLLVGRQQAQISNVHTAINIHEPAHDLRLAKRVATCWCCRLLTPYGPTWLELGLGLGSASAWQDQCRF